MIFPRQIDEQSGMVSLIGIHLIEDKCRERNCKDICRHRGLNNTTNPQSLKKKSYTESEDMGIPCFQKS